MYSDSRERKDQKCDRWTSYGIGMLPEFDSGAMSWSAPVDGGLRQRQ